MHRSETLVWMEYPFLPILKKYELYLTKVLIIENLDSHE